ncbi:MAG: hypothetical protein JWM34_2702 [Ilumatobacteraceae bacterium]|nr:hypothetical protein [Ilumatobacteraceae bacterium]
MPDSSNPSLSGLSSALESFATRNASNEQLLDDLLGQLRPVLSRSAVKVTRRGLWGISRIEAVTVVVGSNLYRASLANRALVCTVSTTSGGIGIGDQRVLTWADWIASLSNSLTREQP